MATKPPSNTNESKCSFVLGLFKDTNENWSSTKKESMVPVSKAAAMQATQPITEADYELLEFASFWFDKYVSPMDDQTWKLHSVGRCQAEKPDPSTYGITDGKPTNTYGVIFEVCPKIVKKNG